MDTKDLGSAPATSADAPAYGLAASIRRALERAEIYGSPYRHWVMNDFFSVEAQAALKALPRYPIDVKGVSGKRELHNDERHYFDEAALSAHGVCKAIAEAFQSREIVVALETMTGARFSGAYLRLEHAHDVDGFWLEPHTDLGVKMLTLLCFLPDDRDQMDLGTDLYADRETWVKRAPFAAGAALMFVPGDNTWHGFEKRPIKGVRTSLIMNYVTDAWRAREQLAFPHTPIVGAP